VNVIGGVLFNGINPSSIGTQRRASLMTQSGHKG
jgi:hypothetical protein